MINAKIKLAGRAKLIAIDASGQERIVKDWFDNLILDQGLDRLGVPQNTAQYCQVGTGTTPPQVSDTGLAQYLTGTEATVNFQSGANQIAPYYGWRRTTWQFQQGQVVGNISEIGFGWEISGDTLFSRLLVTDESGNPSFVNITADEILQVVYELRAYPPTNDFGPYITNINGNNYSFLLRAAMVTQSAWGDPVPGWLPYLVTDILSTAVTDGSIGPITGQPSSITGSPAAQIGNPEEYVPGSYQRICNISLGTGIANFPTGISAILVSTGVGTWQMSVTPPIPKTNLNILTLSFVISWSRT